mmetsp:Transcript_7998/g.18045  ORF Transcript_7998/g.18045 Transcript_7998/m.18045 type:complete len:168 (-) Transcript_7998:28-531(-)
MGDDDKTCVEDEREGGVNVSVSTSPLRCIRAVRLSDAFCLRMTRLDIPGSLFVLGAVAVGLLMTRDPWKEEERAHACIGSNDATEIIPSRTALPLAKWWFDRKTPRRRQLADEEGIVLVIFGLVISPSLCQHLAEAITAIAISYFSIAPTSSALALPVDYDIGNVSR